MARPKRNAECHPDRPHYARGLCKQCYNNKYRDQFNKRRYERRSKDHTGINERERGYFLKSKYGITLEDYDEMLEAQDNACAICGKTPEENGRRLHIDHDHETGEVRGLLCHSCNMLLGFAYDNIDILLNAINYLRCNDAT